MPAAARLPKRRPVTHMTPSVVPRKKSAVPSKRLHVRLQRRKKPSCAPPKRLHARPRLLQQRWPKHRLLQRKYVLKLRVHSSRHPHRSLAARKPLRRPQPPGLRRARRQASVVAVMKAKMKTVALRAAVRSAAARFVRSPQSL
ncbi:hypothetical protein GCM10010520_00570 [Rhizobium viscosum]